MRQQVLYDSIMNPAGEHQGIPPIWERIHSVVFRVARPMCPMILNRMLGMGQQRRVASGLDCRPDRVVPSTWRPVRGTSSAVGMVREGRWPCGYAFLDANNQPGALLVY